MSGDALSGSELEAELIEGLGSSPRWISPVWFYDEEGSRLFDEITRLPEYYLTRAERSILAERSGEIAERTGAATLVEIGSGTSEKTGLVLDALRSAGSLREIVLLDISEEVLLSAADELRGRYGVDVHAVIADLREELPAVGGEGVALWAFLGSTIGNFRPDERHALLSRFRRAMRPGDMLLLGTDLQKDPARLLAAYDDSAGVTAAFNLNLLEAINRAVGGDFDPARFSHRAVWNAEDGWMEMRLVSRMDQQVNLKGIDLVIDLAEGEEILTEISAKFRSDGVRDELMAAGLSTVASWTDPAGDFMLSLAAASGPGAPR